jgi:cephalosporin-C deacetylase
MSLRWLPLLCLNVAVVIAAEPGFTISQIATDGIYQTGDAITWTIKPHDLPVTPKPVITYQVQRDGATVVAQGTLDVSSGSAVISSTLDQPGTLLATITATSTVTSTAPGSGKTTTIKGFAGAVVEPGKILASAPKPADFDAFWAEKLAQLAMVPMNPVFTPVTTEHTDLVYGHLTMDNIKGTHIRGQLARPAKDGRYPALLVVQWAGVYALNREWATGPAREGWLTLNISAHDQPIDQPEQFYKDLANGELKSYGAIGNDDRETSYFLRMFLACSRAVDYLAQRPDWDGRTLIVSGASQGGLQSFVAAGLNPKVTAMMVSVPAGCDNTCLLAGRATGWPYWVPSVSDSKRMEASRYYDAVNFATRVTCPALISLGLLDTTARPTGILAAAQQLRSAKELVIMPESGHMGDHASYHVREAAWKAALKDGKPLPSP